MADMVFRPRVFLDIQIGTQPAGRIIIELFVDKTPKTCEKYVRVPPLQSQRRLTKSETASGQLVPPLTVQRHR